MNTADGRSGIYCGYRGVGDLLARNASYLGRKTGIVFGEQRFSWAEVDARACRLANALTALGVRRGERVAVCMPNSHRWVEAIFGLAKLGAVLVTVNNRLSADEIGYILGDCEAVGVLCGADELPRVEAAAPPGLRFVVGVEAGSSSDRPDYETLLAAADEREPQLASPLRWEDPLMLLYTSGTTGFPKGAIYTHGSTLSGMFIHVHAIGSRITHRVLLPSPLYSAAGMAGIYCAVYAGSTTVIVNFAADQLLGLIASERISFTNLVPTTLQRLLLREDFGRYDLSSLQVLLYGGSPIPLPVLREAAARLPHCGFRQTFASTETGCAGTVLEPQDHRDGLADEAAAGKLLSCGRAQLNVEVRINGEDGQAVAPGELGEIAVRTEANVAGFWNNPKATAEAIRDGWVYTGDMARCDEDGFFYLVDRKRDLIVSGALNVYPSEVERVLQQHPELQEVAVIGVPSEEWGEAVKAVAVRRADSELDENGLIDFCKGKIAGYKKPKSVDFVAQLPRNPTGKILRRELRDPYWSGRERKIG